MEIKYENDVEPKSKQEIERALDKREEKQPK